MSLESESTLPCVSVHAFCKPHPSNPKQNDFAATCAKHTNKTACNQPDAKGKSPCKWSTSSPLSWFECGTGALLSHFVKSFIRSKLRKGGPEFDAHLVKAQLDKEADAYEELDQDELDAVIQFSTDMELQVSNARLAKIVSHLQSAQKERKKRNDACAAKAKG